MGEGIGRRIRRLVGGGPRRGRRLAGRRRGGELEGSGGGVDADGGGFDALITEEVVDVVHGKTGDVSLEEGVALGETDFDVLRVASGERRLPVSVFLVTFCAGGGTGGTPGVFRVALSNTSREMPAVLSERDLPLFSCLCIEHRPRAIAGVDEARRGRRRARCRSCACGVRRAGRAAAAAAAAAVGGRVGRSAWRGRCGGRTAETAAAVAAAAAEAGQTSGPGDVEREKIFYRKM
jgi:hypothetical protein